MAAKESKYSFLDPPNESLFCGLCFDIASQPKQCKNCGKLFCNECIEKNGQKPCPNCRTREFGYSQDVRSKYQ